MSRSLLRNAQRALIFRHRVARMVESELKSNHQMSTDRSNRNETTSKRGHLKDADSFVRDRNSLMDNRKFRRGALLAANFVNFDASVVGLEPTCSSSHSKGDLIEEDGRNQAVSEIPEFKRELECPNNKAANRAHITLFPEIKRSSRNSGKANIGEIESRRLAVIEVFYSPR